MDYSLDFTEQEKKLIHQSTDLFNQQNAQYITGISRQIQRVITLDYSDKVAGMPSLFCDVEITKLSQNLFEFSPENRAPEIVDLAHLQYLISDFKLEQAL